MLKKKKGEQNGVVLSDTVPPPSSPGRAAGEERNVCLILHASLSLCTLLSQPVAPCPFIDETPRDAPCQPHLLATSFGAVAGQQSLTPQALL